MFVVGRRRMAARLETELILSVVPFSAKRFTLRRKRKPAVNRDVPTKFRMKSPALKGESKNGAESTKEWV